MSAIQGWGWDWIKRAHLDQLEFKTGQTGETSIFNLMAAVANGPDEKTPNGKFEDRVKKSGGARLVLRLLDGDSATFFPMSEARGPNVSGKWKFRGATRIIGQTGEAHSAIGLFSTRHIPPVGAFIPEYPALEERLKFLSDYTVSIELIPTEGKNLGTAAETSPREITPIHEDKLGWFVSLKGVVTRVGFSYVVVDCGNPVYVEKKNWQNLTEGDAVDAKGALYAYPEP